MFSPLNGARFVRPWRIPSARPALTLRQTAAGVTLAALASYPLAMQTEALTTAGESVVQKVRPAADGTPRSGRGAHAGDEPPARAAADARASQESFASAFASRAGPLRSASALEIEPRRTGALFAPAQAPHPKTAESVNAPTPADEPAARRQGPEQDAGDRRSAALRSEAAESEPPQQQRAASKAPTACLPAALKDVLSDVEALFGNVTIVSTTRLHTENHWRSSVREKLHAQCKAVDFRTLSPTKEVIAYLRTRPEVGGVNSYRNNVIHIDYAGGHKETRVDRGRATPKKKAQRRKARQA